MDLQLIQSRIYEIRGERVMLDFDLAELYQVETKRLKETVRRNIERFEGDDFMFELSENEYNSLKDNLRSQNATSSWGGRRYSSFAFTEMGVAMLSSVLRSEVAIRVNRSIMRAFVTMRTYVLNQANTSVELAQLRERILSLEQATRDNSESISDLSEDMRKELDTLYEAIGALSVKISSKVPRKPIGYKK